MLFSSQSSYSELRKQLYEAPFLGNHLNEEPSNAQLNGVSTNEYIQKSNSSTRGTLKIKFSFKVMYFVSLGKDL